MRWLAWIGIIAASAACSQPASDAPAGKVKELEAELKDLRAESRELRGELRSLRDELRELRTGVPASVADAGGAPATAGAARDAGPAATAEAPPPPRPRPPARPGDPPPRQESVKISVQSNPTGAKVYVGDKVVGRTPVLLERSPGSEELTLRIEKDGYRVRLLSVRPDEDTKLSVQLAKK